MTSQNAGRDLTSATPDIDLVIVGAGFGGLYAIYKFRELGYSLRAFEAGDDVGGTWYWNRYPGARCDVESTEYSFTFSDELSQEWDWTERFAAQPEILRYINYAADKFDLRKHIQFSTRVTSAEHDPASGLWTVRTDRGDCVTARYVILATGPLSLPQVPKFKGLESFQGKWYHTGKWPHEEVDFTGLRVGVVGTGSSGVQSIPLIAEQASHLYVFQRTAQYSVPAGNRPLTREYIEQVKANYPITRIRQRYTKNGNQLYDIPDRSALSVSPEERERHYESLWNKGGLNFLRAFTDLLTNLKANETAAEFVRRKIREKVKDPELAEKLIPYDHPIGTKRPISDTGYFETYNRPNVTLVDLKEGPIEEITPSGIRTSNGEYELDAIVFATGFDALTGPILNIDIGVKGGFRLAEKWEHGPRTFLGLMTAGLPNFFTLAGPGSPSVLTNIILMDEQHVDWIADLLEGMRKGGFHRVEPDLGAEDAWVQHVHDLAQATLYPLADSWYMGANIPGKPRLFFPYVGGLDVYRRHCEKLASEGYPGLVFDGRIPGPETGLYQPLPAEMIENA